MRCQDSFLNFEEGGRHEVRLEDSERKVNTQNGTDDWDFFADFWRIRIFLRFSLDVITSPPKAVAGKEYFRIV